MLRSTLRHSLAVALTAAALCAPARAQTPSLPPPPYNVDIGALITNALRGVGTVTSAVQQNLANRGVVCRSTTPTVSSGSPSATFGIQVYDTATATWLTYGTSGVIGGYSANAAGTPYDVMVHAGIAVGSLPTNMVGVNLALPRAWRVTQTIAEGTGGTGRSPALTSKIGCNYLD